MKKRDLKKRNYSYFINLCNNLKYCRMNRLEMELPASMALLFMLILLHNMF